MGLIERRIGLLFAAFVLMFGLAIARAGHLTLLQGASLKQRALGQQMGTQKVPAPRGAILDRNGEQLAVSTDAADVSATPYLVKDAPAVATLLSPVLGVPADRLTAKLADREAGFVYLKRGLDGVKAAKLRKMVEHAQGAGDDDAVRLDGIDVVQTSERAYPERSMASQILGFVGTDGKGLSGVEYSFEQLLHGTDGERRVVKDARGDPIQTVESRLVQPGTDVQLTIDSQLQLKTEAVLAELGAKFRPKGATAVVMDPRNGEVLALANWPRFDANHPESAPPEANAGLNRAIGYTYEPGSTFKAFTVAGAIEERLVTPGSVFDLPPTIQVGDRVIKESHDRGGVSLTVAQILAQSSNVGSVKIGLELGAKRFDHWVREFGFGAQTGIDLTGEERGIVLGHEQYSGSSMGNMPIGQGLAVTPIQMGAAYSAIANGGTLRQPRIVRAVGDKRTPLKQGRRVISTRTAASLRSMLQGVLGPGGTASEAAIPGYELAGKTGTAQKPDPVYGGYSKDKYVASFIGFAPAKRPELLVSVMVDEPKGEYYGGLVAAPAFQQILQFALPYYKIAPHD